MKYSLFFATLFLSISTIGLASSADDKKYFNSKSKNDIVRYTLFRNNSDLLFFESMEKALKYAVNKKFQPFEQNGMFFLMNEDRTQVINASLQDDYKVLKRAINITFKKQYKIMLDRHNARMQSINDSSDAAE